ncbi:hypothetical protein AGR8A_Cc30682 [Agrobacterium fabrum str. J-07]|nr:hypothetical protein AGR8A_Cc30682 [Agrobacterium fabrum str. J-07]
MIPSLFWSKLVFPEQYRKPERKKSRPAFVVRDAEPQPVRAPGHGRSGLPARPWNHGRRHQLC